SAGAGTGATTENLKGGVGSASIETNSGSRVGALAIVNAVGRVTVGDGPHFRAALYERNREFGGLGLPSPLPDPAQPANMKGRARANTTLCVVATDAVLTKAQCALLATMAGAGLARALDPVFTPLDGDIVFAAATGARALADPLRDLAHIGAAAA